MPKPWGTGSRDLRGESAGRLLLRFRKTESTPPKKVAAGATGGVRQGVHDAGAGGLIFSPWQGCSAHLLRPSGDRSDCPRAASQPDSGPRGLRSARGRMPGHGRPPGGRELSQRRSAGGVAGSPWPGHGDRRAGPSASHRCEPQRQEEARPRTLPARARPRPGKGKGGL